MPANIESLPSPRPVQAAGARPLTPEEAERNRVLTGHVYTFRWCAKWVERNTAGLDRDDAAAMVALHVLRKWDQYDPARSQLSTWIRCVARTVVTQHESYALADCRDARRTCRPPAEFAFADRRPDPAAAAEDAEQLAHDLPRVLAALAALPARLREVIELRYGLRGEPWTLKQVGEALGCTRENVRHIERQALTRLREAVGCDPAPAAARPARRPGRVKPRRDLPRGFSRMVTGKIRFCRQRTVNGRLEKVCKVFPTVDAAQAWLAANDPAA